MGTLDAQNLPVLYSFRRCPYAMRARLAIKSSQFEVELREIVLRNKPEHMVEISPKATVPVLQLQDGTVLEESRDIIEFVLSQNDPAELLAVPDLEAAIALMNENDGPFKANLDRYKYPGRYDLENGIANREAALPFLEKLNSMLEHSSNLFGENVSVADIGIFPFIRQFANVDREWFDALKLPHLQSWLARHLESDLFASIMPKYTPWTVDDEPLFFGR